MIISDDENVVAIPVKFKEPPSDEKFLIVKNDYGCLHPSFIVDDKKQEVECAKCGEKMNPMFVLIKMAREETKWHRNREVYYDEMKRLDERSRTKCYHCGEMTKISRN